MTTPLLDAQRGAPRRRYPTERLAAFVLAFAAGACATDVAPRCYETALQEVRVCADAQIVAGIDVSYYQGAVDWAAVKAAGKRFAIARVSDGTRVIDTQFARNWRQLKANGFVRGVYQFFRPGQDPVAQANIVIDQVRAAGGFEDDDLPAVIDLETTDSQSSATVVQRARTWLQRIEAATGKRPLVYTAAFMSSVLGSNFSAYPLWVANYGVTCPTMPTGWGDWIFWQSSSTGRVAGISGNVDLDTFNGTFAQLQAFAARTVVTQDAGIRPDAGVSPDAGIIVDAGVRPDAGIRVDAGLLVDGGARDGGAVVDAGPTDAGLTDGGDLPDGAGADDAGAVMGSGGAAAGDACRGTLVPF